MISPYPEYASDIAVCTQIHKKYGKSFYFGTLLLSREERDATCVLYAFFRYPDEYVDTYYSDQKDIALEKLNRWKTLWQECYRNGFESVLKSVDSAPVGTPLDETEKSILRAAHYIFHHYNIPFEYSEAFLAVMVQDTSKDRYETYEELEQYMYGSASVVGLMMTYVICASDTRFASDAVYRYQILEKAQALGEAFQMTNFLRDVGEDMRDRGRIYLPLEDMKKFGVSEDDIKNARITPQFIALMKFEIERTRGLYRTADMGISLLPRRAGKGIYIARVLYGKIIEKIEKARYDVFSSRAHLSFIEKIAAAVFSYTRF